MWPEKCPRIDALEDAAQAMEMAIDARAILLYSVPLPPTYACLNYAAYFAIASNPFTALQHRQNQPVI